MPLFVDRHKGIDMPPDMLRTIERDIHAHQADSHGVVTRGIILDKDANETMCITEARDEDAVRKHHESVGVPAGDVHRCDCIL